MTVPKPPAFLGEVEWDGSVPPQIIGGATQYSDSTAHYRVWQKDGVRNRGQSSVFHFKNNNTELLVSVFGRICHWPYVSSDVLKAENQAERVAHAFTSDLEFMRELAGDFAIVVWDARAKLLYLIRDHLGTRPLFYTQGTKQTFWATDIESIVPKCSAPDTLFSPLVVDFLQANTGKHADRTLRENVRSVPQASAVILGQKEIRTLTYWHMDQTPRFKGRTEQEIYETGRALVCDAISQRVPDDAPITLHLSGGLDSSLIAAVVCDHLVAGDRGKPMAVTWLPPVSGTAQRDQQIVAQFAGQIGVDVVSSGLSADDVAAFHQLDPADGFLTQDLMLEIAAQRALGFGNAGVVFSGWGGDQGLSSAGRSKLRAVAPAWVHNLWSRMRYGTQKRKTPYTRPEYGVRRPSTLATHAQSQRRSHLAMLQQGTVQDRMTTWSIYFARHDTQFVFPLLDRRVIEFALSVPAKYYSGPLMKRNLMRQIAQGLLPDEIRLRPDKDEPSRFSNSKSVSADLAGQLFSAITVDRTSQDRQAYLDMDYVRADMEQALAGRSFIRGKLSRVLSFLNAGRSLALMKVGTDDKS